MFGHIWILGIFILTLCRDKEKRVNNQQTTLFEALNRSFAYTAHTAGWSSSSTLVAIGASRCLLSSLGLANTMLVTLTNMTLITTRHLPVVCLKLPKKQPPFFYNITVHNITCTELRIYLHIWWIETTMHFRRLYFLGNIIFWVML